MGIVNPNFFTQDAEHINSQRDPEPWKVLGERAHPSPRCDAGADERGEGKANHELVSQDGKSNLAIFGGRYSFIWLDLVFPKVTNETIGRCRRREIYDRIEKCGDPIDC